MMMKGYINKVLRGEITERYIFNMNALTVAISNNQNGEFNNEIDELMTRFPHMINEYDVYGFTPLSHAINYNDTRTTEKLINKVEFHNSHEAKNIFTTGHSFCSDRILTVALSKVDEFTYFPFLTKDLSEEVSKLFVSKISKNMVFEGNWTPLMLCVLSNRKNICRELICQGHDIHRVNNVGHNAFDYCFDEEIGRLLYYYDSAPIVYFELYNHILDERHCIYSFLNLSDVAMDIMDYLA